MKNLERLVEPFVFVVFGATGDLSRRKLLPAFDHLAMLGYLPPKFAVVGVSRTCLDDQAFRELAQDAINAHRRSEGIQPGQSSVVPFLFHQTGDILDPDLYQSLRQRLHDLNRELGLDDHRLFYLAVAPSLFRTVVQNLSVLGMFRRTSDQAWARVIIEKPFGHDLESAKDLNRCIQKVLTEDQIYRIDHYLGKETVQNILTFRFGNSIFEPLFTRDLVKSIQITVAETEGMEGHRGAYYDSAGALRDIVQNHMLQLLCLITMEPPATFSAEAIRDEKVKVLRALLKLDPVQAAANAVRGQYRGYRNEPNVSSSSNTETFVAVRTAIENWRWSGVPMLLKTGKRLKERATNIVVEFRSVPHCVFREFSECPPNPNVLVLRIQPNEGIGLSFQAKKPGARMMLQDVQMDFHYGQSFDERLPEAYERLLLDALRGDPSLFIRSDEVELAWEFVSQIQEGWKNQPAPDFPNYEPGTDEPEEANRLFRSDHSLRQ